MLLVKAAGSGDSPTLLALRALRLPCTVLPANGHRSALDYLHRRGQFVGRPEPDPDLVLIESSNRTEDVTEFILQARAPIRSKPCPIIVLADGVADRDLSEWYLAGANSVLNADDLDQAVQSVAWYWLAHNRTPLQR